jgi:hypothetical protein
VKGIIGSGFGLYGHLPAFSLLSPEPICMPIRYKEAFEKRPELMRFKNNIVWLSDERVVLEAVKSLALSVWPKGQELWVELSLAKTNIHQLFLEKPLATSPDNSNELLSKLIASKKKFRINYSFLYTSWYKKVKKTFCENEVTSLTIRWSFLAHHYKHNLDNWKRHKSLGGSVIRFYGIHFLALLADLEINEVVNSETRGQSEEDMHQWQARFTSEKKTNCSFIINSKSLHNEFNIELTFKDQYSVNGSLVINLDNPFSEVNDFDPELDSRVKIIENFHASMNEKQDDSYYKVYAATNEIWQITENNNLLFVEKNLAL